MMKGYKVVMFVFFSKKMFFFIFSLSESVFNNEFYFKNLQALIILYAMSHVNSCLSNPKLSISKLNFCQLYSILNLCL